MEEQKQNGAREERRKPAGTRHSAERSQETSTNSGRELRVISGKGRGHAELEGRKGLGHEALGGWGRNLAQKTAKAPFAALLVQAEGRQSTAKTAAETDGQLPYPRYAFCSPRRHDLWAQISRRAGHAIGAKRRRHQSHGYNMSSTHVVLTCISIVTNARCVKRAQEKPGLGVALRLPFVVLQP